MTKQLKHFCMLGLILLGLILPGQAAPAAEQIANVALPEFTVKLNGQTVDNQYRRYPLLVYKDITYFPMTWYDCRLLGLETEWTQTEGLRIVQNRVTSAYDSCETEKKNNVRYRAGIPSYPITVNGTTLDNTGEEYPLLSFNNITYFPLTWRFAHGEFGWDYKWNGVTGLSVP